MRKTKKILSVLLSVLLMLSACSVIGSARYNAGSDGYAEYEQTAYENGMYDATTDQIASMLFDLLDYTLENAAAGKVLQLTDPVSGGDVKLDFSVIDSTDKLIASCCEIISGDRLGGSFDAVDTSALGGVTRAGGDLKLGYALIKFLSDNADILKTLLTGSFDFGKVAQYYPELQKVVDFDLRARILKAFGIDKSNENRATADEFLQSLVKKSVEEIFSGAGMQCSLDIISDSAYDFAQNILFCVFNSEAVSGAALLSFIQQVRMLGIESSRYIDNTEIIKSGDSGYDDISQMFSAEYGDTFPVAAITKTETVSETEYLMYYIPFCETTESGTEYFYVKLYTCDAPVIYWSADDVPESKQESLRTEYGSNADVVWTSAQGEKYVVIKDGEALHFQTYIDNGFVPSVNANTTLRQNVLSQGTLTRSELPAGVIYTSAYYMGEIAENEPYTGELSIYDDYVPAEYNEYPYTVELSDVKQNVYIYNGKAYIHQTATAEFTFTYSEYNVETGGYDEVVVAENIPVPFDCIYELMPHPTLSAQLNLCFNFDMSLLGYDSTANGSAVSEVNHIIYNFVKMLLKEDVFASTGLVDGANINLSSNINKIVAKFWEPVLEIIDYTVAQGELDNITYDSETGLQGYFISWMRYVFNDAMGGSFITLGEDVTSVGQFAAVCIQECFNMLGSQEGEMFTGFNFDYKAQIYDSQGKALIKTNAQWLDVILGMGVDLGIFMLNKFVKGVGLSPEKVAECKASGFTWYDFLDDAVDWALTFVEGVAVVSTDLAHERGVTDGNGPWYKLSVILSDVLAPLSVFSCGKSYSGSYVSFDLGALIVDKVLTGALELDIGKILSFLETNTDEGNIFYSDTLITAALKTAKQAVNSVLPGTVLDSDITSFENIVSNDTLSDIACRALKSLNNRKLFVVPAALEILAKCGMFSSFFMQGICGDNLTWKLNSMEGVLRIYGYGNMYNGVQGYSNGYFDKVEFIGDAEHGGITGIGAYAFEDAQLSTLEIPNTVTNIGVRAFTAYDVFSVSVQEGSTSFAVDKYGLLYSADIGELIYVPAYDMSVEAFVTIPDTVYMIRQGALSSSSCIKTLSFESYMSEQEISAACGNDEIASNVYCHETSGMSQYCSNNSISFTEVHFPGYDATVTPATCTEAGSWTGSCRYCGAQLVNQTLPALGHIPGEWTVDSPATCSQEGLEYCECTVCNDVIYTRPIKKAAHTLSGWVVVSQPTCTEDGLKEISCTVCGEVGKEYAIPATGHTPGEWTVDEEATCSHEGSRHSTCTVCSAAIEDVIPKSKTHADTDWTVTKAATCTATGISTKICAECGDVLETKIMPRLTHVMGEWVVDVPSDCVNEGSRHQSCTLCGKTVTEKTPVSSHSAGAWIIDKAATCTEEGSKHTQCTGCGITLETAKIPKAAHTPGAWITDKAATCTEEGSKHTQCTFCGITLETAEIQKTAHTPGAWITDKAATCTEKGSEHTQCTFCGTSIQTHTVEALGHTDTNNDNACDRCGADMGNSKPKPQSFADKIKAFFERILDFFKNLFG